MNNIENIQEYIPTVYVNDSEPDLDETNLNKTEQAIKRVTDAANKAIDALKQLDREKLALSAISNVLSDATDKVPSLALANTMQLAINDLNSNFGANRYTDNIDNLFKNCIVQLFPSLGTTGTFPVSDINGSFLRVVNNGSDFCFQQLDIITNKHTTSYIRSWYYGNDTVYPGWSDWRRVITNADIIHGNTDAFSVPANGEHRVTLNLSQYNVGTDYRLYATVRGSTWVNLGAIYCNNNQAIIDLRNLNSTAVNVTLWYTIIRK